MNYRFGYDNIKENNSIYRVYQNINPPGPFCDVTNLNRYQRFQKFSTPQQQPDFSVKYVNSSFESPRKVESGANMSNLMQSGNEDNQQNLTHSVVSTQDDQNEATDLSRPRRKPRTVFSRTQLTKMKEAFNSKPYLTTEERRNLSIELNVSAEQIKVWFQNHRSKLKRQGRMISNTGEPMLSNILIPNMHYGGLQSFGLNPQASMGIPYNPNQYMRPIQYPNDQQAFEYLNQPSHYSNSELYTAAQPNFYPNQPNNATAETNQNVYNFPPSRNNNSGVGFVNLNNDNTQNQQNNSTNYPQKIPQTYVMDSSNYYKNYNGNSNGGIQ